MNSILSFTLCSDPFTSLYWFKRGGDFSDSQFPFSLHCSAISLPFSQENQNSSALLAIVCLRPELVGSNFLSGIILVTDTCHILSLTPGTCGCSCCPRGLPVLVLIHGIITLSFLVCFPTQLKAPPRFQCLHARIELHSEIHALLNIMSVNKIPKQHTFGGHKTIL